MQKTPPKLEISFRQSFKASANGRFAICALLMTLFATAFGYLAGATNGWWQNSFKTPFFVIPVLVTGIHSSKLSAPSIFQPYFQLTKSTLSKQTETEFSTGRSAVWIPVTSTGMTVREKIGIECLSHYS